MVVKFKKLSSDVSPPTRGSKLAAGYDLHAFIPDMERVLVYPNTVTKIRTGIALELPHGYFGAVYPRSGLSTKEGLRLANNVGVIDEDYKGELMVCLYNDSDTVRIVKNGDRIAQLVVQPYLSVEFEETEILTKTDRGSDGFGSTGKQ